MLEGNRYWAEALPDYMGQKLVIRFDPQDLKAQVAVYTLDGRFICEAANQGEAGFDDIEAARDHSKARKTYIKAAKAVLEAQKRLGIERVASLSGEVEDEPMTEAKVIKLVANGRAHREEWSDMNSTGDDDFARGMDAIDTAQIIPFARSID